MTQTTNEREALESLWPFLTEEMGLLITPEFNEAIEKTAKALGKTFVSEIRKPSGMPTMFYVKEIE